MLLGKKKVINLKKKFTRNISFLVNFLIIIITTNLVSGCIKNI
ncbi:hypothetical protein CLL_A1653 [Clostridium botulinum B str. Eklund 17B (NRP)]|uniref:Uncharacterized protein n=1 Tax=Clostridium botulinum (strain Eklund 17B / Type B) TaxID=935198 RepID=B2TKW6_CLOBB|nr:hypothetical protein CLL_A1653 [Clostridium botulinum B str. Eklund 17B (NRP)]